MYTTCAQFAVQNCAGWADAIVAMSSSMFVYSGRDAGNHILNDLWRYDVADARWTQLQPVAMNGWNEIVEWGLQLVMTPRGMVVVTEDCPGSRVACRRLVLQDPFTEQWETIENVTASQKHAAVTFISPKRLRNAQAPWFAEYAVRTQYRLKHR